MVEINAYDLGGGEISYRNFPIKNTETLSVVNLHQ